MPSDGAALISVDGYYADAFIGGTKQVELRRRSLNLNKGDRVWVYSKLPLGAVEVVGIVDQVVSGRPQKLWEKYGNVSALNKAEFDAYFLGCENANVIVFSKFYSLKPSITLKKLREIFPNFHPPQFAKYLKRGSKERVYFDRVFSKRALAVK